MRFFTKIFFIIFLIYSCSSFANICMPNVTSLVDNYLKNLKKFSINFIQKSNDGIYKGILLIEKPRKFRVNYEKSHPLLFVGNINFISIYDFDLDEFSRISSKDNIFQFLLEDGFESSGNINIISCLEYDHSYILKITEESTQIDAEIQFKKNPIQIKNILISNNKTQKNDIEIEILSLRKLKKIPADLFLIKNPKMGSKIEYLSLDDINSKIE